MFLQNLIKFQWLENPNSHMLQRVHKYNMVASIKQKIYWKKEQEVGNPFSIGFNTGKFVASYKHSKYEDGQNIMTTDIVCYHDHVAFDGYDVVWYPLRVSFNFLFLLRLIAYVFVIVRMKTSELKRN